MLRVYQRPEKKGFFLLESCVLFIIVHRFERQFACHFVVSLDLLTVQGISLVENSWKV